MGGNAMAIAAMLERQNEVSYKHLPLKMAAITMVKVNNAIPL